MYERILVALDGSPLAEEVLPHVASIATRAGSEVILLRVCPPVHSVAEDVIAAREGSSSTPIDMEKLEKIREEEEQRIIAENTAYLDRIAGRFQTVGVSRVKAVVTIGDPAEQIVDYAKSNAVDLVAMSTHGRTGISRWVYGSVANRVLQGASVPILLIRSKS